MTSRGLVLVGILAVAFYLYAQRNAGAPAAAAPAIGSGGGIFTGPPTTPSGSEVLSGFPGGTLRRVFGSFPASDFWTPPPGYMGPQ